MKKIIYFFLFLTTTLVAQNPIVPPGVYLADPEAHVWKDGKIYIYTSRDESDDYWCSNQYHVLSSSDMRNWRLTQNSFASKGKFDQVSYCDQLLFAPDCAYKDGTYYLYYCSPSNYIAGVATSTSPDGPFINGVEMKYPKQIDPAVLVDDDGQAYYLWGQNEALMAKLKPNMVEIDSSTVVSPLDDAGNKAFHEGSCIRRIGEWYYLIFADESRNGRPTCLGYAMSRKPMGPYAYKGIIIDNIGSDPKVWNNHGSIERFKDKWYVFYHRSTNNSQKFRKACVEPISINKNGTIDEVEMTSQGALPYLKASSHLEAEMACQLKGQAYIGLLPNTDIPSEGLINIHNGDVIAYKYLLFDNENRFKVKVANSIGGEIELRLDHPDGPCIGKCKIPEAMPHTDYTIASCAIEPVEGKRTFYLVFRGKEGSIFTLDYFEFDKDL